jgi:hypothetical protein
MVDTTFILAAAGLLALVYAINLYIDFKRYEAAMGYVIGYPSLNIYATLTISYNVTVIYQGTERCCRRRRFLRI